MFPERMLALMKEKKISRKTISEAVGFGINQIKYWETHGNVPSGEVLTGIAQYLGVSVDYLLEKTDIRDTGKTYSESIEKYFEYIFSPKNEILDKEYHLDIQYKRNYRIKQELLSEIEKAIIELFRTTSEEGQIRIIKSCMDIHEDAKHTQEKKTIPILHSLLKVSAGTGAFLDDEYTEEWHILKNYYTKNADFCVTVTGDSMEPTFMDGDIVLVRSQPEIRVGEIGVFLLNGEGYIKEAGDGCLISHNCAYEDIPITAEDQFVCFGKVLGVLKKEWVIA